MTLDSQDHDLLIKHDTIISRVEAKVDENAKESIRRDTELRIKMDSIIDSCASLTQGIREIQQTERTNSADRAQVWERLDLLWSDRATEAIRTEHARQHQLIGAEFTPEAIEARKEHNAQHQSMWSAFNVFRFLSAAFLIEQPIILGALGILLTR